MWTKIRQALKQKCIEKYGEKEDEVEEKHQDDKMMKERENSQQCLMNVCSDLFLCLNSWRVK